MKKIILLSLLVSLAFALNAQTTYNFTGAVSASWSDPNNWTVTPSGMGPPTASLPGDIININADCNLNTSFAVPDSVTLNINAASFQVNTGKILNIYGTVNVSTTGVLLTATSASKIIVKGAGTLNNSGVITNNGTLTNRNDLNNSGTINNSGTFTNANIGTINNSGGITNNSGATLQNNGDIYNNTGGVIINNGTVGNKTGDLYNNGGTYTNLGTGALPITLLSFQPYKVGNTVVVKWITASEKENAYMEVQRSRDGIHFISIHHEKGHGTTSQQQTYEWTDEAPMQGVNYYRLKQVDFDSNATVHEIRSVDFDGKTSNSSLHLYPTEVQNQLTVVLDAPVQDDQSALLIVDMLGRIVQQHKLSRDAVQQDVQVGNLPSGQYFITLQSGKTLQTARFVKL